MPGICSVLLESSSENESVISSADHWRQALEAWAIPREILDAAEESPWIHPVELFLVPAVIASTPSHERAREALREGGSVLDVGCGAGVAAFALTPPAVSVIGVDQHPQMLSEFRVNAEKRGVACRTYEGSWPELSEETPSADVVTAHHVVYNVADIAHFLRALDEHARARVVLEMPDHHPLAPMSAAWRHFWQLERPQSPTPSDLVDVLDELEIRVYRQTWKGALRTTSNLEQAAHFMRIRLCLPKSRESEVREFLSAHPAAPEMALSTIWWDA
jgi:SAM-dependent methyltransferase